MYNEEMKSEIAVTRRATYKAEENVAGLEKGKKEQDLYIDTLNEQLKGLHERLALYEAQLVSQRQETKVEWCPLLRRGLLPVSPPPVPLDELTHLINYGWLLFMALVLFDSGGG